MALKKLNRILYYLADTKEELNGIPTKINGATCFVEENKCEYKLIDGEWIEQSTSNASAGESVDLSNYAEKTYVDTKIANIKIPQVDKFISKDVVDACYRPIKFDILNLPEEAVVTYKDREIRVLCPVGTVFKKQNVGETGNPNMYYMTFRTYLPEGTKTFKEGDRGVIVDEILDDNTAGVGTDKFGRKYKDHWFALASLTNEAKNTWSYFGANSFTDSKPNAYIGWSYVIECYDENGKLIDADSIRVNLSNENCHLNIAPYYG